VVIIFGLHMIGLFHIPFLAYDTRVQQAPDPKLGYLSSALMGVFFSAGWSPCVGPVLGAILTLAINGGSVSQGATLLTFYSAGLAIPFLIAALGIGWVTTILKKYNKVMRYVEIAMGVILSSSVSCFSQVFSNSSPSRDNSSGSISGSNSFQYKPTSRRFCEMTPIQQSCGTYFITG
jgi:thiol:disulfide interchange protein